MNKQMELHTKSEHLNHRHHHRRRRHRHRKKLRFRKMLPYLLPITIVCAGIAALINSGSNTFLTSYGNVAIRGIIIVCFPVILIFYLCRLFADWIFNFFSFLYALVRGKRH